MKKLNIRLILFVLLLLPCIFYVSADELPATHSLSIGSTEEFLELANNCRLDSYSKDLTVTLTADIDLTDQPFTGIPIFCGTFDGNGHTISGLHLDAQGSNQGLFRYLTDTATVKNLMVSGTVSPKGSSTNIGGIAGNNAGTIENCHFSGIVTGTEHIGGIAGSNSHCGVISGCSVSGNLYGNHFVGGITGSNSGIIDQCTNTAKINTELQQNDVTLSDITIDSLTGTESAGTVTDIGGIAGISSGSITGCKNEADIGYKHMGYNIGGIAGCQTGYIADCINTGSISGRKEIGGIVGQLEPAFLISYSTDTIQILQSQLNELADLTNNAVYSIGNTSAAIQNEIVIIQGQIENAVSAFENLIPEEDPESPLPDSEAITEAVTTLQNAIASIRGSLENIYSQIDNAETSLTRNLRAISNSVAGMQQTLNSASENLGGSVMDHSDADTEETKTAKVERCQNSGTVYADLNAGGIVGAIAFENDLDPEDDVEFAGDSTLNFAGTYRAVIAQCDNTAAVTVKKQYGGGIVGLATLGLVRSSTNSGDQNCPGASYVGGIAGRSDGYIRSCSAKCRINAEEFAGGIAGQGQTVSDCRALSIVDAKEKSGSILGYARELTKVSNNFYMLLPQDIGAIDGISYEAIAQPLDSNDFLLLEDLPASFQSYRITFVFADGTKQALTLKTNELPSEAQIPSLPEINGSKGTWIGLEDIGAFDRVIECVYDSKLQVVQSDVLRDSGLPILLAEGSFAMDYRLLLSKYDAQAADSAIEAWSVHGADIAKIHYLPPENYEADGLCVMGLTSDGTWQQLSHMADGSYLIFTPTETNTFCIVPVENFPWYAIAAGSVLLILVITVPVLIVRRKKSAVKADNNAAAQQ